MHTQFNTSSVGGGNTGSSSNLTNYLDKEQENNWFTEKEHGIDTATVTASIDKNGKGQLGKEDWKFVEVEYNPSAKEQQAIIKHATGRTDVTDWKQLSQLEKAKVKAEFGGFVRDAQKIQANNYNRENIKSGADLVYYAKIETQRKYKGTDERVKNGEVNQGQLKEGLNMHAHIVQSRKGADKKTKLSPTINARKASAKNPVKAGFDRNEFYNKIEKQFDNRYNYNRELKESFEWKKAEKFGREEDKKTLKENFIGKGQLNERDQFLQKMKAKEMKMPERGELLDNAIKRSKSLEQNTDQNINKNRGYQR